VLIALSFFGNAWQKQGNISPKTLIQAKKAIENSNSGFSIAYFRNMK
jgi:hypothetical protein